MNRESTFCLVLVLVLAGLLAGVLPILSAEIPAEAVIRSVKKLSKSKPNSRKQEAALESLLGTAATRPFIDVSLGMTDQEKYRDHFSSATVKVVELAGSASSPKERAGYFNLVGLLQALVPTCETGETEWRKQRFECASTAFAEAVDSGPPMALLNLADLLIGEGSHSEALPLLEEFKKTGDESFDLYRDQLECWVSKGDESIPRANVNVPAPVPSNEVLPTFTEEARSAGLEGFVILYYLLDEEGVPVCVRPLKGLPLGLTEAAIRAALQSRYYPTVIDGQATKVRTINTTTFASR